MSFNLNPVSSNNSFGIAQATIPSNSETRGRSFSSMCTTVFSSIKSCFQPTPAPLNTKSKDDLTNVCVHLSADVNAGKNLEEVADAAQCRCGNRLVKVALFALLANYAGYRVLQSQRGSSSQLELTEGTEKDLSASMLMHHTNRVLLSSSSSNISNYSISVTEEVLLSQTFNTWDVFPFADQGRLIVSTTSTLPAGVTLEQAQMQVVKSIPASQSMLFSGTTRAYLATDEALYLVQGGDGVGTVQIIDIETFSVKKVFTTGAISDMDIVGDILYCVRNDTSVKIFNISQPFNPVALGQTPSLGVGAAKINLNTVDGLLGCVVRTNFFCVDVSDPSNPIIKGNITLPSNGNEMASSPGYYYIGTITGLAVVNVTDPSSPTVCGFLPTTQIYYIQCLNDICYLTVASGPLLVIDVKNPASPVLVNTITFSDFVYILLPPFEDLMFFLSANGGLGTYSIKNKTNPVLAAPLLFFINGLDQPVFQNKYMIFLNVNTKTIDFATRRDTFSFSGTPKGGSEGNYSVVLTATTLSGQEISQNQTFEFKVGPAIVPSVPIPNLIGAVDQVFNKIINPNSFTHVNGKSLVYSLDCGSGNTLSSVIDINPVSAQLFGTPPKSTIGTTRCTITAEDSEGASATSLPFNVSVYYGPTINPVQNQIAVIGQPFSLEFGVTSKDLLTSNSSGRFTFSVSNLPSGFTLENDTIVGTPLTTDLGTYPVFATVVDQNGLSKTTTFTLNVVMPGVPVFRDLISSPTAFVGTPFSFVIPSNAAINPNNPNTAITYSASFLPSWLSFDGIQFTGTPPRTEILFADVIYSIVLTATQKLANGETTSSNTLFSITVSGTSVTKQAFTVGGPIFTVLLSILAARFFCYNRCAAKPKFISCVNRTNKVFCCCCSPEAKEFHQSNEVLIEGQNLEHTFITRRSKIAKIETFYNEERHPERLPHWLKYDVNGKIGKISTEYVPELNGIQSIRVVAFDNKGYKLEEVVFAKEVGENNDRNFSRLCQFDYREFKSLRYYSGGVEIPAPDWISYHKMSNRIIAANAPFSLKEMAPMTIYVLGENNKILEKIYINKAPMKELDVVFDDADLKEEKPLLEGLREFSETNESQFSPSSSSSTEMVELKKERYEGGRSSINVYAQL